MNGIRIDTYGMHRSAWKQARREERFNKAIDVVPGLLALAAFVGAALMWAAGII